MSETNQHPPTESTNPPAIASTTFKQEPSLLAPKTIALFSVAIAFCGIALVRADPPTHIAPLPPPVGGYPPPGSVPQGTRVRFSGPGLSGTVGLSQSAVAVGRSESVYAEVELNAEGEGAPTPSAISVVIDTSGSMQGEKMSQAIRGAEVLLQSLRDEDWVSIVQYSDRARVVGSPGLVRYVRQINQRAVRQLDADGGTNIREGLILGASNLAQAPMGFALRLLLLSDGQDTYNANAHEATRTAMSLCGNSAVSSLGIGRDYDESFMNTVANVGQGNYAYLQNTANLYAFFQNELQQTNGTTADHVHVALRIPPSWRVQRSYGAELQRSGDNMLSFEVGAVTRGFPRRVVVELQVPAEQQGFLGQIGATIHYSDPRTQTPRSLSAEGLALHAVANLRDAVATRDMEVYGRSRAFALADQQTEALQAWRSGDADRARAMSARVETEARDLAAAAPAAAASLAPLQQQANEAQQNYATPAESAAGAGWGRRAGARSSAAQRGGNDALSNY